MKKMQWKIMVAIGLVASVTFMQSCDEDEPAELALVSLTAGTIDLNGATTPNNVPIGAEITATFSTDVNPATADANITLLRDYDDANVDLDITVNGNVVTIKPSAVFGTGTLYALSFGAGLASTQGKTLTATSRSFTTEGTFAVSGAVAHWTFEDNANDVIGSFDPPASGIVGISYGASHNANAGKAAEFNGTTSIIEIPNGDQLMNTNNFTLSFWVKAMPHTDNANKGHFVMGLGAFFGFQFEIFDGYNGFKMPVGYRFNKNGTEGWAAEDNAFNGDGKNKDNGGWQGFVFTKDLTTSGGVSELIKGKWAHIVYSYNASTKQGLYYVNGQKMREFDFDLWPAGDNKTFVTGLKYNGTAPEVVNELAFGFVQSRAGTLWDNEPWGGYAQASAKHFKGSLDDVIIYNKVLTEAEIQLMYNSGK
ncbi:MAG: Ig-like domain-containing protein [Bacteroidota bacterium]